MPTPYSPAAGKRDSRLARDQLQELVRGLNENARAVAGVGLATAGAAVVQVQQHLQRLLNNRVGLPALDVDHEPHATGFMLEPRVVKTLLGREGPSCCARLRSAFNVCSNRHFQEIRISRLTA